MKFFALATLMFSWNLAVGNYRQPRKVGNESNGLYDLVMKNTRRLDRMEKKTNTTAITVDHLLTHAKSQDDLIKYLVLQNQELTKIVKKVVRKSENEDRKIAKNTRIMNDLASKIDKVVDQNEKENKRIIELTSKINKVVDQNEKENKRIIELASKLDKVVDQNEKENKRIIELASKINKVVEQNEMEDTKINETTKVVNKIAAHNEKLSKMLNASLKNISQDVSEVKGLLSNVPPGKTQSTPAESCTMLNTHHYNLKSGKYWLTKGDTSSFEYCTMDEAGVPPAATTTAAPTTEQPTTEPFYRGVSCKGIKKHRPLSRTGVYTITVGGEPFEVFCDMDTDGGGWLKIGSAVVKKESDAKDFHYEKIQHDDFTKLVMVKTGRFFLSTKGLNSLYDAEPFTEIRFDCRKPYHERRVNLKTKGEDVVQWLLQKRIPAPPSCNTFVTLQGDTSIIGHDCRWWKGETWWAAYIYAFPILAKDEGTGLEYTIALSYSGLWCDDIAGHPNVNNIGNWSYYVR